MLSSSVRENLTGWFKENNGFMHENLAIENDDLNGVHFRARDSISKQAENLLLCRCPLSLSLSYLNVFPDHYAVRDSSKSSIRYLRDLVLPHTISYFFLMEQLLLGSQSYWSPYIESLPSPEQLMTPFYFGENDLEWLKGTNVHGAIEPTVETWRNEWTQGCEILCRNGHADTRFTFDLYMWAANIFSSRAFSAKLALPTIQTGISILYPVMDIFNHRVDEQVIWLFQNGEFGISSLNPIERGSQVFNNYSNKSNGELLLGYGFCVQKNPYDIVTVQLSKPSKPVYETLKQLYPNQYNTATWETKNGLFHVASPSYEADSLYRDKLCPSGIPMVMFRAVLEFVLSSRKVSPYHSKNRISILSGSLPQNQSNDPAERFILATYQQLLESLRTKLMRILVHDADLPTNPQNRNQRYSQIYRDGQRSILTAQCKTLQDLLFKRMLPAKYQASISGHATGIMCLDLAFETLHYIDRGISKSLEKTCLVLFGCIAASNLREADEEDTGWMLWLTAAWSHCISTEDGSPVKYWITQLESIYPFGQEPDEEDEQSVQYLKSLCQDTAVDESNAFRLNTLDNRVLSWVIRVFKSEVWQMKTVEGPRYRYTASDAHEGRDIRRIPAYASDPTTESTKSVLELYLMILITVELIHRFGCYACRQFTPFLAFQNDEWIEHPYGQQREGRNARVTGRSGIQRVHKGAVITGYPAVASLWAQPYRSHRDKLRRGKDSRQRIHMTGRRVWFGKGLDEVTLRRLTFNLSFEVGLGLASKDIAPSLPDSYEARTTWSGRISSTSHPVVFRLHLKANTRPYQLPSLNGLDATRVKYSE
ncbi:SET domain-containing protein [Patellaria atrata CBS 101060]|uniref:SET domain-containing protein n=1 Tax=Patellaria atrata CBS 101060 TaxID=1346257 RepID=A0A9P4VM87_9PEZI|nr:SET domain-containing protein [Patellaria atrata CBS 101060]